ncbi:hypothetical protein V5799_007243, partial [Amblyomma americanum]
MSSAFDVEWKKRNMFITFVVAAGICFSIGFAMPSGKETMIRVRVTTTIINKYCDQKWMEVPAQYTEKKVYLKGYVQNCTCELRTGGMGYHTNDTKCF